MKNILIVRQHNQLGDMLCVTPLLRALSVKFPHARMTLVCSPENYEIMRCHETLHEVICFDKRKFLKKRFVSEAARFFVSLRRKKFDLALVPSTVSISSTSNLIALLSGASTKIGPVSLEGRRSFAGRMFDVPVDLDWQSEPHRHQTLRNFDIAASLHLETPSPGCSISLTSDESEEGARFLREHGEGQGPRIAMHPGAGKIPNRWPASRFADVANYLSKELGARIIVTVGPMDGDVVEEMSGVLDSPPVLVKRSIREVAAVLAHVDLLLSNDTGIMHVGAAVDTPVLSLFGPTDPLQWAPAGGAHRFLHLPSGNIRDIPVDEVRRLSRQMLSRRKDGS